MKVMKSMKRAGGATKKGRRANPVLKKCKTIAPVIKTQDSIPAPVRSILSGNLLNIFGTYKEDRHSFQKTCSDLVHATLKAQQNDLQKLINEAELGKTAAETEGHSAISASESAQAASDAAVNAADAAKEAAAAEHKALSDAKKALHDLENEGKAADKDQSSTDAKKQKLEATRAEFFAKVRDGELAKGLSSSASHASKILQNSHSMQSEFVTCVKRTYAKASADWGTFDKIVDKELDTRTAALVADMATQLAACEASKEKRAKSVEDAKAEVATREETVKAAEAALAEASANAKEAKASAKAAAGGAKEQQKKIDKASHVFNSAQGALTAFNDGPLAAFSEVEAHTAPPPPPEPVQEDAAPAPIDQAMTAAPAKEVRTSPSILASPGLMLSRAAQAVGLGSPRIAPA
jgi:hypothetical protein